MYNEYPVLFHSLYVFLRHVRTLNSHQRIHLVLYCENACAPLLKKIKA